MKRSHTLTQKRTAAKGRDAEVDDLDIVVILVIFEKDVIELQKVKVTSVSSDTISGTLRSR